MGLQQILMIVLSVILVGSSIALGIYMFNQQAMKAHQNEMISAINMYVGEALAYKKTPTMLGGGGGSFHGFKPAGGSTDNHKLGWFSKAEGNSAVVAETNKINFWFEFWPDNASHKRRLVIVASSKVYGNGDPADGPGKALIRMEFDANGNILPNFTRMGNNWPRF